MAVLGVYTGALCVLVPHEQGNVGPGFQPNLPAHLRLRPHLLHDDPALPCGPAYPLPQRQPGHPAGHFCGGDNYRHLHLADELRLDARAMVERRNPRAVAPPLHLRTGCFFAGNNQRKPEPGDSGLAGILMRSGLGDYGAR